MQALEEAAIENPERVAGLEPWQQVLFFLAACAILVTRRWDALSHAQFYAEDGRVFFADAYNRGWFRPVFDSYVSYLHFFPRICSGLALLLPFSRVPLFFSSISLVCSALTANIILSSRSDGWGPLRMRALLAAALVALPNCREVSWGLAETNFWLAIIAVLLLIAQPPRSGLGKTIGLVFFTIFGLTGPFCIFLLPFAVYQSWRNRSWYGWLSLTVLTVTSLVQAWAMLILDPKGRGLQTLAATPVTFLRLIGGQVVLGALVGSNILAKLKSPTAEVVLSCFALGGIGLMLYCFRRASTPMRIFLLYTAILLAACLISPLEMDRPKLAVWEGLATVPGQRYWFFPTMAFVWSLVWLAWNGRGAVRTTSRLLLAFMLMVGVVRDWEIPKLYESHFAQSVEQFNAAAPGTVLTLPEGCPGWTMRIVKH